MIKQILSLALAYAAASHTVVAQTRMTSGMEILKKEIPQLMKEAEIAGLSISVIDNGKVIFSQGFGYENTKSRKVITGNTVFEGASLGKPLLAYLAIRLVEEGHLSIDAPIGSSVKGSLPPAVQNIADKVSMRMLLSHTSGLPNARSSNDSLRLYFPPGERFSYSGEGIMLLQQVIEKKMNLPVDSLMKKYVFLPLMMAHSSFIWLPSYELQKAYGHNELMEVMGRNKPLQANAANSLHTTATDYGNFFAGVLKGINLKEGSRKDIITAQIPVDSTCVICLQKKTQATSSSTLSWGLGWGLEKTSAGAWMWHWGDNVTFKGFAIGDPATGNGFVYFANSTNGLSIAAKLTEMILGQPPASIKWLGYGQYDSPVKKQLQSIVLKRKKGVDELEKKQQQNAFSASQINWIGEQLLNRRLLDEAAAVYRISLREDSLSVQALTSLGNVYLQQQKRSLALQQYQKALALSPQNQKLAGMVARLSIPMIKISSSLLQSYRGRYRSPIGMITISQKNSTLFVQPDGAPQEELVAKSETVFISLEAGVVLEFKKDSSNNMTIGISIGDQKFHADKVQ